MDNQSTSKILNYLDLGIIDYKKAWNLQKEFFEKRVNGLIPDSIFLLEHPNTYTLGKTADRKNLIGSQSFLDKHNIKVYDIDRGGDITYHGPGQLVGYPILNLKNWAPDTDKYLRGLEEVIISVCSEFGLECGRKPKYTGVWIGERKICAIGIKVSRWVTMHGFALNVNTDLDMFNGIIPCGIKGKQVTSLEMELGRKLDINEVKNILINKFQLVFDYDNVNKLPVHERSDKIQLEEEKR